MRKGKRLPLEALAPYVLAVPDPPGLLDWRIVFGNDHSMELEVGFGKGAFLVESAQSRPDVNFVGVEVDRALQLYVATRLAKRELRNARVAKADARAFIQHCVGTGSLRAVHVYFPDPWWKKRHKKRRVFTESFARECSRVLQPRGRLHLATDVEEYFGVMTQLVEALPSFRLLAKTATESAASGNDAQTNFARKALARGGSVWRALYERS